uniref:Uncharacterized protein n=1 Tax=Sipha flava TaxID=143950 RepID=A0A2S2R014_9HEMI
MSSDDQARANRLKRRCEIRRKNCVNKIRAVYDLAVRSAADSTVVPQLLVLVDTLDQLMSSFNTEDEALLNQLIDMELDAEYPDRECVEMLEMVSFAQATANRLMQYCAPQTILSVHGGSQVFLNNVDVNEPQTNVHASNGAGAGDGSPGGVQSNNAGSLRSNSVQVIKPTRLPEIPLPSFYGDIYKWISFRDRFAAMVDRRSTLSDIEKFYYLVGCCKGDALDAIRGIPVADHNYKLAWSTLKERFDKPRLVACSLIERLLSAPRASSETLAELNKLLVIFDEGVSVLKSMEIPNLGDFILFSIASRCLPTSSIKLFEAQLANGFPTVQDLLKFVKSRVAILECIPREPTSKQINELKNHKGASYSVKKPPIHSSMVASSNPSQASQSCICCKGTHVLASCPKFKSWTLETRSNWARDQRICFRCLRTGHWVSRCKSSIVCGQCSRRHHSLLHPASSSGRPREENTSNAEQMDLPTTSSLLSQNTSPSVILGTALIHMPDSTGVLHTVRALIDSASQISAITAECSNRLGLRIKKWTVPVSGIGGVSVPNVLGIVQCRAQPRFSPDPVFNFEAWVFSTITTDMPRHPLTKSLVDKYKHLALADPSFAIPGSIDVLLGADLFSEILNGKRVSVGSSYPAAFGTVFGWTIIGAAPHTISHWPVSCPTSLTVSCETLLHKFWEIEEPDTAPEEFTTTGQCESMFQRGCVRVNSGRYSVPLLFRQPTPQVNFTGSRAVATKRFGQLEKKLMSDQRLRSLYCQFMAEYQSDGHMSPASSVGLYFIPHHAVYRPSETNPKIRVVFDASAKDYSGTSLNDVLFPGPKLQQDVVDVLLLFRLSRFAFTCDISKMYRQILISPEHRPFQHVLWRASPEDELQAFELNTVTYGVNCSPFLAIRVLHQIADMECDGFPFVREALLFHTYVDDICVGADSEAAAIQLQSDLITILRHSGMELKKWTSNIESVLNNVPNEDRACDALSFHDGDSVGSKVLGIRWDHHDDSFNYFVKPETLVTTKRGMLSLIARIFDPLGLLAPVIFQAKHLMQSVWKANIAWDENLPNDILKPWTQFVTDLPELQRVRIPRFVHTRRGLRCVLCGFCDASERGYAAVVYIKSLDFCERPSVSLLGAKTKLAPVKAYTIPRMELCAAVLLARWMARLKNILDGRLQIVDTLA